MRKFISRWGHWGPGAALLLVIASVAIAQVFNKFGPVTGILKGSATTYQTSAAASSDVIGLWTGTCSSSTFLRGDGACAAGNAGTVTSITAGTGLTGGTITTSGTIALSTPVSATNGGSGEAGTITGLLKGNGTSAFTAGASSDVTGLFSGTCSSSTFLRGDGSCQAVSASPASPSTSVQFNNSGAFGGDASFEYTNGTNKQLTIVAGGGHSSIFSIAGNNGGFQTGDIELSSSSAQVGQLMNFASATMNYGTNGTVYLTNATNGGWITSNNSGQATGGSQGAGTINAIGLYTNGVSVTPLPGTTGSIGGGALGAGACTSGTVSVTGSTTSMTVNATPGTYPGDGTVWMGYVSSAGTVTVKVCSIAGNTPGATTYNVRVTP